MLNFAVVVAACLLFALVCAESEQLVRQALQSTHCLLNGSCTIHYWPLQLGWLDNNLHFVVDDLVGDSALMDALQPIVIAKRLVIAQRDRTLGYNPDQAVVNKVIVVDELVCWKTYNLRFVNVTIIAKVAIFENVAAIRNSSVVAEFLRLYVTEVEHNSLFANRLYLHPDQRFSGSIVVSNYLRTSSRRHGSLPLNVTDNFFIASQMEFDGAVYNVSAHFERNTFVFSNLTISDKRCELDSNEFYGFSLNITNINAFCKNKLVLNKITNNKMLPKCLRSNEIKVLSGYIKADMDPEENIDDLATVAIKYNNVEQLNDMLRHSSRHINITGRSALSFVIRKFSYSRYGHETTLLSSWSVNNFWLAVPALLAPLLPDAASLNVSQFDTGIPPYLSTEPCEFLFEVQFKFDYSVLDLIVPSLSRAYQRHLAAKTAINLNRSCSNVTSSDSLKSLLNEPLPINRSLLYRAQDVLTSKTLDSLVIADTINFYGTANYSFINRKTLIANTVNFYYGFSSREKQIQLVESTIIANTVRFETFEHSQLWFVNVVIVAKSVYFKLKHSIYSSQNYFSQVVVFAEHIAMGDETLDDFSGSDSQTFCCKTCAFFGKIIEIYGSRMQLTHSFLSADTLNVTCYFCSFDNNVIVADRADFSGINGKAYRKDTVWTDNALIINTTVQFFRFEVTLNNLELNTRTLNVYCVSEEQIEIWVRMPNVSTELKSVNFSNCPKYLATSNNYSKPKQHENWSFLITYYFSNTMRRFFKENDHFMLFNNENNDPSVKEISQTFRHSAFSLYPNLMNFLSEQLEQCQNKLVLPSLTSAGNKGEVNQRSDLIVSYSVSFRNKSIFSDIRTRFETLRQPTQVHTKKVASPGKDKKVSSEPADRAAENNHLFGVTARNVQLKGSTAVTSSIISAVSTAQYPERKAERKGTVNLKEASDADEHESIDELDKTEDDGEYESEAENEDLTDSKSYLNSEESQKVSTARTGIDWHVITWKGATKYVNQDGKVPAVDNFNENFKIFIILLGCSNGVLLIVVILLAVTLFKFSQKLNKRKAEYAI